MAKVRGLLTRPLTSTLHGSDLKPAESGATASLPSLNS